VSFERERRRIEIRGATGIITAELGLLTDRVEPAWADVLAPLLRPQANYTWDLEVLPLRENVKEPRNNRRFV